MIKAITFDLDGVYFVNGKSNFIKAITDYGVDEEKVREVFLKSDQMNKAYKAGKMSDQEYWDWAISQWGLDMSVEEIKAILIDGYETNNKVVEVVKQVRDKGYKTLICSNNFPARIEGLDKRFSFLRDFDYAALSYKVGETKPSKEIFEDLVRGSEVRPEEIIFADDHEDNLVGAKELGVQTFVYKNFVQFIDELKNRGVKI